MELGVHATDAGDRTHSLQHSGLGPSWCVLLLLILYLRLYAVKRLRVVLLPLYTHRVPDTLIWSSSNIGLIVGPVLFLNSYLQERIYFIYLFTAAEMHRDIRSNNLSWGNFSL